MLLWLDFETTGLSPTRHTLLEVACILTEDNLDEVAGYETVINPGVSDVMRLLALTSDAFVIDMHTKNGLVEEINLGAGVSTGEAEEQILELIEDIPKKELFLAGNSVHFDMKFLEEHMPKLAKRLSYRLFDVRVLMMAEDMWTDGLVDRGENFAAHRAMSDISYSLELARKYRHFFLPTANT